MGELENGKSIFNGSSTVPDSQYKFGLNNPAFDASDWNKIAVVVMDMWDHHHIAVSSARVNELAPWVGAFCDKARSRGALIIHSPSDVSGYFNGQPARDGTRVTADELTARQTGRRARPPGGADPRDPQTYGWYRPCFFYLDDKDLQGKFNNIVPNDRNGGGTDGSRQNKNIIIHPNDAVIADGLDGSTSEQGCLSYQQLLGYTANRPNIVYCGVHANMCILNRYNCMRTLYRAGKSLWLVRDLTDCMSSDNDKPIHFKYTDQVVTWIGKRLGAATLTSEEAGLGLKRFRFLAEVAPALGTPIGSGWGETSGA